MTLHVVVTMEKQTLYEFPAMKHIDNKMKLAWIEQMFEKLNFEKSVPY